MSDIILALGKGLIRVGGLVVIHVRSWMRLWARCPQLDSETSANCLNMGYG